MGDTHDYIRVTVPAPGEQFIPRQLRSELILSARIWEPISTVGTWDPQNPLPDSIFVELSHVY